MSFGVLLNNRLISKLCQDRILIIEPWDIENLQIAQYALNPSIIIYEDNTGKERLHDLQKLAYTFQPNEYAKVKIEQTIILTDGIVGRFIPASGLIEAGFGITAGKLDPQYGASKETIQFGLKNLKDKPNVFSYKSSNGKFKTRVAYIEFFDIRSLPVEPSELREYDYAVRNRRRLHEEFSEKGIPDEY